MQNGRPLNSARFLWATRYICFLGNGNWMRVLVFLEGGGGLNKPIAPVVGTTKAVFTCVVEFIPWVNKVFWLAILLAYCLFHNTKVKRKNGFIAWIMSFGRVILFAIDRWSL